ncbi:retrovirus-related pol polyprotein from transposon TNT 1-94 [Tanacetum coccineum]
MEEYVNKTRGDYYSGITKTMINGIDAYELKGKFLDDLRNNAFSGTNGEDAVEHIENFLKIVDPLDLPNVSYELLRLAVFPISLTGDASEWLMNEPQSSITTWVDLTDKFFGKYYPPSRTGKIMRTKAKWDSTNVVFENWLASKFTNHMMMDPFTKNALWDYWKRVMIKKYLLMRHFLISKKLTKIGNTKLLKYLGSKLTYSTLKHLYA